MEIVHPIQSIEGFIVAEKGQDGIGFQVTEPFIGSGEMADSQVGLVLGTIGLGAREGPLALARGMGPETRSITGAADIADREACIRIEAVHTGFKMGKVQHPFPQTVAQQDDAVIFPHAQGSASARTAQNSGRAASRIRRYFLINSFVSYPMERISPPFLTKSSRANGDRVLVRVSCRFAGEAGSTPRQRLESNEVCTSAGIPERSRKFV